MSTVRPLLRAFVASSFLIVLPFAAAQAAEPADVANRLKDALARQDVDLQWKGISGDASSMVLSGVTAGASGTEKRAEIGDITLTNVSEDGDDYVIGNASLPTYSVVNEGATASMTFWSCAKRSANSCGELPTGDKSKGFNTFRTSGALAAL